MMGDMMGEMITQVTPAMHFDGILHWCMWIGIAGFVIGALWILVRVLIPLRLLALQAASMASGHLPTFDTPIKGIQEMEDLRRSLQYMVGEIRAAQTRELSYRSALTESTENERKRVAREIHDDTIQSLVVVAHSIERASQAGKTNESNLTYLETARRQLIQTIDNLRALIADLRPTILDELGLAVAIEALCDTHPALEFAVAGEVYELDHDQELAIYRAAQEAIHNAERHAHAGKITATLTYSDSGVTLDVCDDGNGFRIPSQLQEFAARGHYGLLGIKERMVQFGGTLTLRSGTKEGTRVRVTIPMMQRMAAAV